MAQQTWTVRARCSGGQENGLLTFLNDDPTGQYEFEVRGIDIRTVPSNELSLAPAPLDFRLITAVDGGDDIDMVAHNTIASAIPAQVRIVNLPNNVTFAGGSDTFRGINRFVQNLTSLYHSPNQFGSNSVSNRNGTAAVFDSGRFDGNDGVVLAEGEGIALAPRFHTANAGFLCNITILVGARTYTGLFELYPPTGQNSQFAIFNGSGSGVTVTLLKVEIWQSGSGLTTSISSDQPTVRITRVNDIRAEGEAVNPIPHNGSSNSIPYLTIRQGTIINPITLSIIGGINPVDDLGYPSSNTAAYRRARTFGQRLLQHGNGLNNLANPQIAGTIQSAMQFSDYFTAFGYSFNDDSLQGFVIRSGEGLAIIANNTSPYLVGIIVRAEIIVRKNPSYYSYS